MEKWLRGQRGSGLTWEHRVNGWPGLSMGDSGPIPSLLHFQHLCQPLTSLLGTSALSVSKPCPPASDLLPGS